VALGIPRPDLVRAGCQELGLGVGGPPTLVAALTYFVLGLQNPIHRPHRAQVTLLVEQGSVDLVRSGIDETLAVQDAQYRSALDLFEPTLSGYEFTVVVTNKTTAARHVVRFHHGRGAQEGVFAELKSQGQLDYVPTRTLVGNQLYLLAALLAYNLNRELQMSVKPRERLTTPGRTPLWRFSQLETVRRTLVQRAGRLTRPKGKLTLTISANQPVRQELLHYLDQLQEAA